MDIIQKIRNLQAQQELVKELLESNVNLLDENAIAQYLLNKSVRIDESITELEEERSKFWKETEDSFTAGFDMESENEESIRKLVVRFQDNTTIRFRLNTKYSDGSKSQNSLLLSKDAFYLFFYGFKKAIDYFELKEHRATFEKNKNRILEYIYKEDENKKS